ncbi:hypothetical protein HDU89_000978 [Geranomyces variabilis]|nr:hypothetical protein HDU89_000978 [Geranomyces variabilis]
MGRSPGELLNYHDSAVAIEEQKRRTSTGVPEDEDKTVHVWLHDLLVETFRGCECLVLWANRESASSKGHRASWARSGKRPDFRVIHGKYENAFGEFKRQRIASYNQEVVGDFIKLAVFLQGSINEKVRDRYCPNDTFGFQFAGERVKLFN